MLQGCTAVPWSKHSPDLMRVQGLSIVVLLNGHAGPTHLPNGPPNYH
jgi:hypothetical protein